MTPPVRPRPARVGRASASHSGSSPEPAPASTQRPRPTLAQLRAFTAVAQAGGFGEAAAELGMSQSSLSEGVAGLERLLGQRLFRRRAGAGGATLTEVGGRVLIHATRVIQASEDLMLSAQDEEALTGTLTVTAYRSLGVHLLPAALAEVHARFPRLEVRVLNAEADTAGGERLILERKADVGLILASDAPFLSYPLIQDEYVAVMPAQQPDLPLPVWIPPGRTLDWADLSGQTLLMPTSSDACTRQVLAHLQSEHVAPAAVMEFADDDVIYSMAAHGMGIAIQPWLATTPLRSDLTTRRFTTSFTRSLVVATLPGRASLPHIFAFTQAVRRTAAQIGGMPPEDGAQESFAVSGKGPVRKAPPKRAPAAD